MFELKIIKKRLTGLENKSEPGNFYFVDEKNVYIRKEFMYLQSLMPLYQFIQSERAPMVTNPFQVDYYKLFYTDIKLLPPGSIQMEVPNTLREELYEKSTIFQLTGRRNTIEWEDYPKFYSTMKEAFNESRMMKSNQTSGKNEVGVVELKTVDEALNHMLSVKYWNWQYKNDPDFSIFLIPWNKDITLSNEFRIFVLGQKIVTICLQKWYIPIEYDVTMMYQALECLEIHLSKTVVHESYSADVYFKDGLFHLIEINPWGNSGPGLFSYQEIYQSYQNQTLSCAILVE